MDNYFDDNEIINGLKQLRNRVDLFHNEYIKSIDRFTRLVNQWCRKEQFKSWKPEDHNQSIAVIEGKIITQEQLSEKDEYEAFDIIIDVKNPSVRCRKYPDQRSPLGPCDLGHIGSRRFSALVYLIENPCHLLSQDNYDVLDLTDTSKKHPSALAHTIQYLRKALGQPGVKNPYIISKPYCEDLRSKRTCCYKMSDRWNYLLKK